MDLTLARRLIAASGGVLAVLLGWHIAHQSFALAGFVGALLVVFCASRVSGVRPDAFFGGLALVGYLAGNRGFAQIHPPQIPLLAGEATLALALVCLGWRAARAGELPLRRDVLNFAILSWLIVGAARMPTDLPRFGAMALRDFAMVYYALFFFVGQDWAGDAAARRWIDRCLTLGLALVAPVFGAFSLWTDFFVEKLAVGGVPLIFVKGDVAAGFMVAGVFWFLDRYVRARRFLWLALVGANLAGVLLSNSRAALVALLLSIVWIALLRVKSWLRPLAFFGALGAAALLVESALPRAPGKSSYLYRLYESAASIVDIRGAHAPVTSDLADKPDNNRFRKVWWTELFEETVSEGPWFGLGFGRDLAAEFVQIYYPESTEEFSTRSPHNFLLSVFGRMGAIGFALFALLLGAILVNAGRSTTRRPERQPDPAWLGALAILVTACFGVVLEGPMGAVVFWILLGLAHASSVRAENDEAGEPSATALSPSAETAGPAPAARSS